MSSSTTCCIACGPGRPSGCPPRPPGGQATPCTSTARAHRLLSRRGVQGERGAIPALLLSRVRVELLLLPLQVREHQALELGDHRHMHMHRLGLAVPVGAADRLIHPLEAVVDPREHHRAAVLKVQAVADQRRLRDQDLHRPARKSSMIRSRSLSLVAPVSSATSDPCSRSRMISPSASNDVQTIVGRPRVHLRAREVGDTRGFTDATGSPPGRDRIRSYRKPRASCASFDRSRTPIRSSNKPRPVSMRISSASAAAAPSSPGGARASPDPAATTGCRRSRTGPGRGDRSTTTT
jgi:hypothetical protein